MNDKQKIETLKHCFEETIWMAIRYAHGRHTYAPTMLRNAIKNYQLMFPDWKLRKDPAIKPPATEEFIKHGISFRGDYLDDLFDNNADE